MTPDYTALHLLLFLRVINSLALACLSCLSGVYLKCLQHACLLYLLHVFVPLIHRGSAVPLLPVRTNAFVIDFHNENPRLRCRKYQSFVIQPCADWGMTRRCSRGVYFYNVSFTCVCVCGRLIIKVGLFQTLRVLISATLLMKPYIFITSAASSFCP